MIKKITMILICMFISIQMVFAGAQVKITHISGEVKIRRGVEETWQVAVRGMLLKEIDTIQTGEGAEVTLEINSGESIKLGGNSILDISDLRKISEKEMLLFLMSKKIQKIEPRKQKTPLRVGNVSVVHGESKAEKNKATNTNLKKNIWRKETNGAKALFDFQYYTNTVIKLNKILSKYSSENDCGEIHYYLGRSFEALNKNGQAIDAYEVVIKNYQNQGCNSYEANKWFSEAQDAVKKLKKK